MAAALGSFRGDGLSSAGSTPVMFARSAHTRQNVLHSGEEKSMNIMPIRHSLITTFVTLLIGISTVIASPWGAAKAQIPSLVQPWGLPPLPPGVGQVEKFADVSNTPQGQFLEGGSFDTEGNLWFVAIGSGWDLAEGHQLPKRLGQEMLSSMVERVTQHLRQGDRIRIGGLGTLEVRKREARTGRNLATGETMQIGASKKVAFRPAKELKEAV